VTIDAGLRQELLEDGVLVLAIDLPERNNAWNADLETAYLAALDAATRDDAVRAVVLTGTGRAFCPGMDTQRLQASSSGTALPYLGGQRRPQTSALFFPKPLVAAVNGACAGVGFIQALMCDVRFTVPEAKWTFALSRRGLNAEDAIAWRLQRIVGVGRAADLLLSSRVVKGDEALALGLVKEVVQPDLLLDRVLEYARDIVRNVSPVSYALVKRQLLLDADATVEESRLRSVAWLDLAKTFPDYAEGVRSFVDRRPPDFPPLPRELQTPLPGPPL
jgi:enoyl-CoA hydratase/carnithine racemase